MRAKAYPEIYPDDQYEAVQRALAEWIADEAIPAGDREVLKTLRRRHREWFERWARNVEQSVLESREQLGGSGFAHQDDFAAHERKWREFELKHLRYQQQRMLLPAQEIVIAARAAQTEDDEVARNGSGSGGRLNRRSPTDRRRARIS